MIWQTTRLTAIQYLLRQSRKVKKKTNETTYLSQITWQCWESNIYPINYSEQNNNYRHYRVNLLLWIITHFRHSTGHLLSSDGYSCLSTLKFKQLAIYQMLLWLIMGDWKNILKFKLQQKQSVTKLIVINPNCANTRTRTGFMLSLCLNCKKLTSFPSVMQRPHIPFKKKQKLSINFNVIPPILILITCICKMMMASCEVGMIYKIKALRLNN